LFRSSGRERLRRRSCPRPYPVSISTDSRAKSGGGRAQCLNVLLNRSESWDRQADSIPQHRRVRNTAKMPGPAPTQRGRRPEGTPQVAGGVLDAVVRAEQLRGQRLIQGAKALHHRRTGGLTWRASLRRPIRAATARLPAEACRAGSRRRTARLRSVERRSGGDAPAGLPVAPLSYFDLNK